MAVAVTHGEGVSPPLLEHGAFVFVGSTDGNQAQHLNVYVPNASGIHEVVLALGGKGGNEGGGEELFLIELQSD